MTPSSFPRSGASNKLRALQPEFAARYFYDGLAADGREREALGGLLLPQWALRFDLPAILKDFAMLDQPSLREELDEPVDRSDVRYAAILSDGKPARWLTLMYFAPLSFWAVAHYGANALPPSALPEAV